MTSNMYILSSRSIFKVSGEEVVEFLNRILTCRVDDLAEGKCRFGALLTPQGKILTDLFLFRTSNGVFYLDLPVSEADAIIKRLTLLKLRADVSFEPMLSLSPYVSTDKTLIPEGSVICCEDPRTNKINRGLVDGIQEAAASDQTGWSALRVQYVLPECGLDYQASTTFPADINMDLSSGVDFKKGCFVGQEVVSRMKRKTEVRKRTLRATGPTGISAGDALMAEGSTLGEVLNWSGECGLILTRIDRLAKANEQSLPLTIGAQNVTVDPTSFETAAT